MINIELAERVKASISEGDEVEFITGPDARLFAFKVLEIKPFSLIVLSPLIDGITQKLELPISKTLQYIKEIENMRVKAPDTSTNGVAQTPQPATRGRPRNPPAQAAPSQQPSPVAQPATVAPEIDVTDPKWIESAINDACLDFAEAMKQIMAGVISVAQYAADQGDGEKPITCQDCMFVNVTENKCDKFNMTPPMFVIFDAKAKCPDFINAKQSELLDDQIPF